MQTKFRTLLTAVAIPLLVGVASGFFAGNSMGSFEQFEKPIFSPPGYLFPIVWTILYILMGIASWLVYTSGKDTEEVNNALFVYGVQLVVNFFWSIFFFRLEWYLFSFFWLILLWVLILYTLVLFWKVSRPAGLLMIPYLLWVTYAGYLNLGIYLLN